MDIDLADLLVVAGLLLSITQIANTWVNIVKSPLDIKKLQLEIEQLRLENLQLRDELNKGS